MHCVGLAQVVARGLPPNRITEAPAPPPAAKPCPWTARVKLFAAPAIKLEGKSRSIVGPFVTATVAVADFVASAWLVAVTATALGEGALAGAVYRPLLSIVPQAVPLQPCPGTALATLQVTAVFEIPLTAARNCCVFPVWPAGATKAYAGATLMPAGGCGRMVACAVPLRVGSASLLAVRVTGLCAGIVAGAR